MNVSVTNATCPTSGFFWGKNYFKKEKTISRVSGCVISTKTIIPRHTLGIFSKNFTLFVCCRDKFRISGRLLRGENVKTFVSRLRRPKQQLGKCKRPSSKDAALGSKMLESNSTRPFFLGKKILFIANAPLISPSTNPKEIIIPSISFVVVVDMLPPSAGYSSRESDIR